MDYIFLTKAYTESNDTSSTDERYTFGNNILNKQYFEFSQKLHSILRLKIKLILNILISNYTVIHAETFIMVKDSKFQSSNACDHRVTQLSTTKWNIARKVLFILLHAISISCKF